MTRELKVHQGSLERDEAQRNQVQRARPMRAASPFDDIERLFDELLPMPTFGFARSPLLRGLMGAQQARMPSVDVIERDDEIVLRAEVPGIRKEDLDISVDEQSVTLRGVLRHDERDAQGDYYRREIGYGEFARTMALPSLVATDKAKASLRDGVLELTLPKLDTAKRRKIRIS